MRDPKHLRHFTEESKCQLATLYDGGKPASEIMRECDLGKSTFQHRAKRVHETGLTRAMVNRMPGEAWFLELECEAPHGGRRYKTSSADIRTKVTVMAANARRYPVSAQCRILGVPCSTYYHMLAHLPRTHVASDLTYVHAGGAW